MTNLSLAIRTSSSEIPAARSRRLPDQTASLAALGLPRQNESSHNTSAPFLRVTDRYLELVRHDAKLEQQSWRSSDGFSELLSTFIAFRQNTPFANKRKVADLERPGLQLEQLPASV